MKNISEALEASRVGDGHFEYTDEYDTMRLKSTLISLLDEVVLEEWRYGSSAYNSGFNACRQELIKKINEVKK